MTDGSYFKRCPYCAETVPESIQNCTHCGKPIPVYAKRAEVNVLSKEEVTAKSETRPWVRFWARTFDWMIFAFCLGVVLGLFDVNVEQVPDLAAGMAILFLWIFVEAYLLSHWGWTPGKWLLKVCVRAAKGHKLPFDAALKRSFNVWLRGQGLGLPLITLITQAVAYNKLTTEGITSWDKEGNIIVRHEPIGAGRIVTLIAVLFVLLMIIGLAGTMEY